MNALCSLAQALARGYLACDWAGVEPRQVNDIVRFAGVNSKMSR